MLQGRAVDAVHMYQSAFKSMEYSAHALDKETDLGDCLAAAYLRNRHYLEATTAIKSSLHKNPTTMHSWFNMALVREETAVDILTRVQRNVGDIKDAMSEFKVASKLFGFLSHDRSFISGSSKNAPRPSKSKSNDHRIYCDV